MKGSMSVSNRSKISRIDVTKKMSGMLLNAQFNPMQHAPGMASNVLPLEPQSARTHRQQQQHL